MHKRLPFWLVLFAVGAWTSLCAQAPAAAAPASPAPAALPPGQIIAAKVTGTATVSINGATKPLNTNDAVPELATVATGKDTNSSVVLVFSNGATTQLGADSSLEIQQFLQEPFAANVVVANLDAEPTISKTRLHLNKGELVGNVKHLNHGSGSTFVVNTPVGAAGIRGTTFKIVFRPNGTGLAFFSLSTVEGNVNFQQPGANGQGGGNAGQGAGGNQPGGNQGGGNQPGGNNGGGGPGGGNPPGGGAGNGGGGTNGLPVTGGNEVVITVTVNTNPTTGVSTVTVAPPVVTTTSSISAATLAQVTQQAVTIATTAATVTFTPPAPTGGGGSGGAGNSGGGNSGGNSGDSSGGSGNGNSGSGNSSGNGSGSGGGNSNSGSGNGNSSGTNSNGTQNSGTNNFTNPSPPIVPSTPRVTTGDGKSG